MNDQVSAFVKSIESEQHWERERLAKANDVAKWCSKLTDEELPPVPYMNKIGSNGSTHFKSAMSELFLELSKRFQLSPSSSVLDLGCGCGRLAYPFSQFLDASGKYYGVDVWAEGIEFCKNKFDQENMNFICLDSKNNYYFDDIDFNVRNQYNIKSVPDESIDLFYAVSVFTHLTESDTLDYFREIRRTLKKGDGFAYLTCFIMDEYFFKYTKEAGKHRGVKQHSHGVYHAYSGQDFFAGFTLAHWNHMLGVCGLRVVSYELGSWARKPSSRTFQDSFVVARVS